MISLVLVALALLLRLLMAAADLRLPELALASLRGLPRRRMWALGLSEPLTLLLALDPDRRRRRRGAGPRPGALVAGAGAAAAVPVDRRRWPGCSWPLASIGVAVLAVGLVLRVSLSDQLTGVRRPRETSRTGLVVQLALVAARGRRPGQQALRRRSRATPT